MRPTGHWRLIATSAGAGVYGRASSFLVAWPSDCLEHREPPGRVRTYLRSLSGSGTARSWTSAVQKCTTGASQVQAKCLPCRQCRIAGEVAWVIGDLRRGTGCAVPALQHGPKRAVRLRHSTGRSCQYRLISLKPKQHGDTARPLKRGQMQASVSVRARATSAAGILPSPVSAGQGQAARRYKPRHGSDRHSGERLLAHSWTRGQPRTIEQSAV